MFRTCSTSLALITTVSVAAPTLAQTTYTYRDIDSDGNLELTDSEFQNYSSGLFERYDADRDGNLTSDEYAGMGENEGLFDGNGIFDIWDMDRDGGVNQAEFNAGLFGTYDRDRDMAVSEDEYNTYQTAGAGLGDVENNIATSAEVTSLNDWRYDDLYANGISVEALMDADVIGADGEDVGDVENVLFNVEGKLLSVIVEVDGFLDIGDTHLNIPWNMVESARWENGGIMIPFTEDQLDNTENFSLFNEQMGYGYGDDRRYDANAEVETDAADVVVGDSEVAEVTGNGPGVVETGPRVWRAPDLIGDYARVRDGDTYRNYGYVQDIIVRDGQIAAVVVDPDRGLGVTPAGARAYPFTGYGMNNGWNPERGSYDLPYDRTEVEAVQPFDENRFMR